MEYDIYNRIMESGTRRAVLTRVSSLTVFLESLEVETPFSIVNDTADSVRLPICCEVDG